MNAITFKPVKIKITDTDYQLFSELERAGYHAGQIIDAEQKIHLGKETDTYFFDGCVAYENLTANKIN